MCCANLLLYVHLKPTIAAHNCCFTENVVCSYRRGGGGYGGDKAGAPGGDYQPRYAGGRGGGGFGGN